MSRSREMWDIAHAWANDRDGKGIGAGANILYGNGCSYSYGSHFMIARHVSNDKGERAVLFGCFGDMLHPIPWQTDHLFCWQRDAAHALAA